VSSSNYISVIMKHIRSISGINYQNAVNDILYHYYKSENIIFESINSQGGDFKNDGWVPDKGILVIFLEIVHILIVLQQSKITQRTTYHRHLKV